MIENGAADCLGVLRVRHLLAPSEFGKLAPPPFAYGLRKSRVSVTGKIQKRGRFPVLLPHKQERDVRRAQQQTSSEFERGKGHKGAETLPVRPVAHLIMILAADHKALARKVTTGRAVWPFAKE